MIDGQQMHIVKTNKQLEKKTGNNNNSSDYVLATTNTYRV